MGEPIDTRLVSRLRDVLAETSVTETELRGLIEQADGLARALRAQVEASEQRLDRLAADPESSLAEVAHELQRVELLHPALVDARDLYERLELRARELRTAWLLRQAAARPG